MKFKLLIVLFGILSLSACVFNRSNHKAEVLFEELEESYSETSAVKHDSIKSRFAHFDISELDTAHQKAFWFNAYNFYLEDMTFSQTGNLDFKSFMSHNSLIANDTFTTKQLIDKIKTYNDPRMMVCLDFLTTTSSKTYHHVISKEPNAMFDSLSSAIINDQGFVRVKKDIKCVYYPEHIDWQLKELNDSLSSKEFILQYHKNTGISNYKFKPYPFSTKLRIEDSSL